MPVLQPIHSVELNGSRIILPMLLRNDTYLCCWDLQAPIPPRSFSFKGVCFTKYIHISISIHNGSLRSQHPIPSRPPISGQVGLLVFSPPTLTPPGPGQLRPAIRSATPDPRSRHFCGQSLPTRSVLFASWRPPISPWPYRHDLRQLLRAVSADGCGLQRILPRFFPDCGGAGLALM